MRLGSVVEGGILGVGLVLGTWFGGWLAVPILAFLWGLATKAAPLMACLAAATAWGVLLLMDWGSGALGRLVGRLGGTFLVPGFALVLMTLLFAAGLAWAAARLGSVIGAWRRN
jgi:hypothetical protein